MHRQNKKQKQRKQENNWTNKGIPRQKKKKSRMQTEG